MAKLSIAFVGDVYLGFGDAHELDPGVAALLGGADLVVANQEGPITERDEPSVRKCALRTSPPMVEVLRSWGVGAVTLANNHMFDFGVEGFADTCRNLERVGIRWFGAGRDLAEAIRPAVIEVKGVRVGLLGFAWEFVQTTCASPNRFGCAPLEEELMLEAVRKARAEVDLLFVLPHWGYCDHKYPLPEQVRLAQRLLEAGASAVVGSHSHVLQGMLLRPGGPVLFSLGDFAFAEYIHQGRRSEFNRDNLEAGVVTLQTDGSMVSSAQMAFTRRVGLKIVLDHREVRQRQFERLSRPLLRSDEGYRRYWKRAMGVRMLRRGLYWANIAHWRHVRKGTLQGAWLMLKAFVPRWLSRSLEDLRGKA